MRFFEDIEIGQRREIGSFTFTADAIKTFATQFDPQLGHRAGPSHRHQPARRTGVFASGDGLRAAAEFEFLNRYG
jgi:hypothetical protein